MNKVLENKYPYLSNFFKTAISQDRLFHSIILHGSNNFIQYAIALELARQLNCLEDKRENCNCQNCRWIRENQHPAVMTISQIDNKNDDSSCINNNWLATLGKQFHLINGKKGVNLAQIWTINGSGKLESRDANNEFYLRPVVVLKDSTQALGTGLYDNPYILLN